MYGAERVRLRGGFSRVNGKRRGVMLTENKLLELIGQTRKLQEARTPKMMLKALTSEAVMGSSPLQQAFLQFRSDPPLYFTVNLRRMQAKKLQVLLANPENIDVEKFNS